MLSGGSEFFKENKKSWIYSLHHTHGKHCATSSTHHYTHTHAHGKHCATSRVPEFKSIDTVLGNAWFFIFHINIIFSTLFTNSTLIDMLTFSRSPSIKKRISLEWKKIKSASLRCSEDSGFRGLGWTWSASAQTWPHSSSRAHTHIRPHTSSHMAAKTESTLQA